MGVEVGMSNYVKFLYNAQESDVHFYATYTPLCTLQQLLKSIESHLLDGVWNEVEKTYYHKTCGHVFSTLLPLVSLPCHDAPPPHTHMATTPPTHKAVTVVKKLCALSLPDSFLQLVLELAEGKVCILIFLMSG